MRSSSRVRETPYSIVLSVVAIRDTFNHGARILYEIGAEGSITPSMVSFGRCAFGRLILMACSGFFWLFGGVSEVFLGRDRRFGTTQRR
jgi:hypothetical protein